MKKRITWIDDARTLTMLLVVIGHCTYYSGQNAYGGLSCFDTAAPSGVSVSWKILNTVVDFIYSFHMPLFMMLSGVCFSLTLEKTYSIVMFVRNKAKRLLVPFFYTTLLLVIPLKYVSGYYAASVDVLKDMILGQLLVMGNTHLWFVCSLFWIFLMYYGLHRAEITEKQWFFPLLIALSILGTYLYNKRGYEFLGVVEAVKYLFYFAIGAKYLQRLNNLTWNRGGVMLNVVCYIALFLIRNNWLSGQELLVAKLSSKILTFVMPIYGSVVIIQLSKSLRDWSTLTSSKIYKTISRYSYELYLFSDPFNYVLIYLLYNGIGYYPLSNVCALLSFFVRFFGTIILAFVVIWTKHKVTTKIISCGKIRKS